MEEGVEKVKVVEEVRVMEEAEDMVKVGVEGEDGAGVEMAAVATVVEVTVDTGEQAMEVSAVAAEAEMEAVETVEEAAGVEVWAKAGAVAPGMVGEAMVETGAQAMEAQVDSETVGKAQEAVVLEVEEEAEGEVETDTAVGADSETAVEVDSEMAVGADTGMAVGADTETALRAKEGCNQTGLCLEYTHMGMVHTVCPKIVCTGNLYNCQDRKTCYK